MASDEVGFDDSDRQKIQRRATVGEAADRNTTAEECAQWRSRHEAGESYSSIALSTEFTKSTVVYHVYGECSHPASNSGGDRS